MVRRSAEGTVQGDDSLDLPTKEGQHIRQDISVTYNTSQEKAADVFRSFRGAEIGDIESTFIRRTIITTAQNAAGQMSLTDLISNQRGQLQGQIQDNLQHEMNKMGFVVDKAKVAEAEGDAQATLVKAKAQAEANKLLQESLTPLLIQNKAIDKWNGTLPQFTGGAAVRFLNLKELGAGDAHAGGG